MNILAKISHAKIYNCGAGLAIAGGMTGVVMHDLSLHSVLWASSSIAFMFAYLQKK